MIIEIYRCQIFKWVAVTSLEFKIKWSIRIVPLMTTRVTCPICLYLSVRAPLMKPVLAGPWWWARNEEDAGRGRSRSSSWRLPLYAELCEHCCRQLWKKCIAVKWGLCYDTFPYNMISYAASMLVEHRSTLKVTKESTLPTCSERLAGLDVSLRQRCQVPRLHHTQHLLVICQDHRDEVVRSQQCTILCRQWQHWPHVADVVITIRGLLG